MEDIKYLMLSPTSRCNLACEKCNRKGSGTDFPWDDYKAIIFSSFPNLNFAKLQGMGEPFMAKDLGRMAKELKDHYPGIKTLTITNGTLNYNAPAFDDVYKNLDMLYVSIDSVNNISETIGAHAVLATLFEKSKEFGFQLYVNTILFPWNLKCIADVKRLVQEYPGVKMRVQHQQCWNDVSNIESVDIEVFNKFVAPLFDDVMEYIGRDDFYYTECDWNTKRIQIDELGNIRLCCLKTDNSIIGQITDLGLYKAVAERIKARISVDAWPMVIRPHFGLCETCTFVQLNPINKQILKILEER